MKEKKDVIAHIAIIAVILVILIVSVYKLVKWNQGDPNAGATETDENFDVEAEDYITAINTDLLKKDDGKTTIVFLGDDVLADYTGKDGVPEQVAGLLGADKSPVVYNGAFSGTTASTANSIWEDAHPEDAFSLYWVTKSITLKDYTLLNNVVDKVNADYKDTIKTLEGIDWDTVDVITIMYGSNDYLNAKQITDPADPVNTVAYTGALNASIALIKEAYPHIRIVVMAPTYCEVEQDGKLTGCDKVDTGYGILADYMVAAKAIAVESNVTFLDNYYGVDINEDTSDKYLESNRIHPNADGRKLVAQRLVDLLTKESVATEK